MPDTPRPLSVTAPRLEDYRYELPESRIAAYPLPERDASKLLVWREGRAEHRLFRELPDLLGPEHLLVFNDTKVIPARVRFKKPTGGAVEVFLLRPVDETVPMERALLEGSGAVWTCAVGNLKRWKESQPLEKAVTLAGKEFAFRAELVSRERKEVRFTWDEESLRLLEALPAAGETPLPPYLRREAEAADAQQYQTVYGEREGAVAAPTAGLHFTEGVLSRLAEKGAGSLRLTLHVSAGTFRPVQEEDVLDHPMHSEQVAVGREAVEGLLAGKRVVAVGTTSMRTLESLYWHGARLLEEGPGAPFRVGKLYPYEGGRAERAPSAEASLRAVLAEMDRLGTDRLHGATELFIVPGYRFRVVSALVTNVHMPESTLLMLVSAFVGPDWKRLYETALAEGYRFLSFGDGSLLFPPESR